LDTDKQEKLSTPKKKKTEIIKKEKKKSKKEVQHNSKKILKMTYNMGEDANENVTIS